MGGGSDHGLEGFLEPGKAFDGIVVVGRAGLEAEFEIEAVRGGHGGGSGVEVDGGAGGGNGALEDGLGEGAAESESTGSGTNPEALELPGMGVDGRWERAPGDKAGGFRPDVGDEAAATLLDEAKRQAGGFLFERPEAEAGGAGLGDDEAAVFQQEFTGLGEHVLGGTRSEFPESEGRSCSRGRIHDSVYDGTRGVARFREP